MRTTTSRHGLVYFAGVSLTVAVPWMFSGPGLALLNGGSILSCLLPISLCAYFGGLVPGLVACALSLLLGAFLIDVPAQPYGRAVSLAEIELILLGVGGILVSIAAQVPNVLARLAAREETLKAEIADRERVQASLAQSEARLADAEIIARMGIWHVRFGAEESQDKWSLSEGLRHLYGIPPDKPVSTDCGFQLMPPEDRLRVRVAWDAAKAGTGPNEWTHRIILNGETHWMLIRAVFLRDASGRALEASGIDQDVTERTLAEATMRKLQSELKATLEQEVARMTMTTVAHELNQPLNAASTLIEAALRLQRCSPDSPRLPEILHRSAGEIQRAGAGLRHLLASLHVDHSASAPFDLNAAVHEALDVFRLERAPAQSCVSTRLAPDLPPLTGRRLQVEKVLLNLVRNACDARGRRCSECSNASIHVTSKLCGQTVVVSVEDNGPGVPVKMQEHLFEPFRTSKPYGLGMGLAISRAIVESHGGRMWHEARPMGAAFCFSLPQ